MPPKAVVSREDVMAAGLALVREQGLAGVNARSLAGALGCSTQPIFRVYGSMAGVMDALRQAMDGVYARFMEERMTEENRLLSQSIAYVAFARAERHIFNALFMNLTMAGATLEDILRAPWNQASIENAAKTTGLPREQAQALFLDQWLYSHGIATQIVSNQIDLPQEQAQRLLTRSFWRFAGMKEENHAEKP